VATRFCMRCGGEFIASVERCPDCDVDLVDERPAGHLDAQIAADGSIEGEVEYDLHEWAVESRVMLQQLLSSVGIRHAWEGAALVVSAKDESRVDAFVDEVEATTLPALDPEAPKVAYDIDDWSDQQQTRLMHLLEDVTIPYEFDREGALVVLEEHEERVEALLDSIEYPDGRPDDDDDDDDEDDAEDAEDAEDGDDVAEDDEDADDDADDVEGSDDDPIGVEDYDGPEAMDVLSDLFVAADRLRHSATDADGVLALVDRTVDAERLPLPYGFVPAVWKDIVRQVVTLRDLLEDDESRDEDIEEHAHDLRDTLRNYV
jgi:hypothetical protein